jgi:arginine deiminase
MSPSFVIFQTVEFTWYTMLEVDTITYHNELSHYVSDCTVYCSRSDDNHKT